MARVGTKSKAAPKRPQKRGERNRERILAAAERLFAERGYTGTSIDAVAEAVDMYQPGIFYYYPNKRALYEAVMGGVLDSLEECANQALASSASPRARLLRSVESWVDALAARPTAARLLLHEASNPDPEGVPQAFLGPAARTAGRIEDAFYEFLPDAHPDDWFHFESAIAGATLFFATGMQQLQPGRREADRQRSMGRHKQLLMRGTRDLLRALRDERGSLRRAESA